MGKVPLIETFRGPDIVDLPLAARAKRRSSPIFRCDTRFRWLTSVAAWSRSAGPILPQEHNTCQILTRPKGRWRTKRVSSVRLPQKDLSTRPRGRRKSEAFDAASVVLHAG